MANLFLSKKIIIPAIILFGGLLTASGVLMLPNFTGVKLSTASRFPQWTKTAGTGISVPACTSSNNNSPTCVNGSPNVTINWSYNNEHGECDIANLSFTAQPWTNMADGLNTYSRAYGVINNMLYVAQGFQSGARGSVYNPATNVWSAIASAPGSANSPASAVVNGRLYSIGSATYEYNPLNNSWATRAAPPVSLSWGQATAVNDIIYVFFANYNFAYNTSTDIWTRIADPPTNHAYWPAVAAVNGIIYVIGGGDPYISTVDAYNPSNNTWERKGFIPVSGSKGYASASVYNGKIYVFGGGDQDGWDNPTAETWEYDPSLNVWTRKTDMPIPRNAPAVGTIGDKIYVYGGESGGGGFISANNEYNPAADVTISVSCPPRTNNYVWTGGLSNTTYEYVVKILRNAGVIDTSNAGSFTTPACALTPIVSWLGSKGCVLAADGSGCDITATWKVSNVPSETMVDLKIANPIPPGGTTTYSNLLADPTQLARVFTAGSYALTLFDHAPPYAKFGETLALTVCPTGYTIDPATGFCIAPTAPTDFTLSSGGSVACNSVPLSWTASNSADGYRILKGSARVDITPYNPYTALNFTDSSTSQNTDYKYQIEAYNIAGTKRSNALNVTTPNCPPTLSFTANLISMFPKSSLFTLIDKLKSLISAKALGGTTNMNISQGQRVSLNWTTTYVTPPCTASSQPIQGDWNGSKPVNGNQVVVPPPPQVSYTMQCSGPGGTASETIVINVAPLALPEWREIIPR